MSSSFLSWRNKKQQRTSRIVLSKTIRLNNVDNQINKNIKTNDDSTNDSKEYLKFGESIRRTVSVKKHSLFLCLLICLLRNFMLKSAS